MGERRSAAGRGRSGKGWGTRRGGSAGALEAPGPVWEPRWMRWLTIILLPKPPMDAIVVLCSRCTTAVMPPSAISRRIRARASSPEPNSADSAGPERETTRFIPPSQPPDHQQVDDAIRVRCVSSHNKEFLQVSPSLSLCIYFDKQKKIILKTHTCLILYKYV